jgi:hypothetical protein
MGCVIGWCEPRKTANSGRETLPKNYVIVTLELESAIRMCCKNDSVGEPNRSPISPVSIIQLFNPRVSRMNWICPTTSPFGNHLTWPFRIICRTS